MGCSVAPVAVLLSKTRLWEIFFAPLRRPSSQTPPPLPSSATAAALPVVFAKNAAAVGFVTQAHARQSSRAPALDRKAKRSASFACVAALPPPLPLSAIMRAVAE